MHINLDKTKITEFCNAGQLNVLKSTQISFSVNVILALPNKYSSRKTTGC